MKKTKIQLSVKIIISMFFLFLLFQRIDFQSSLDVLKNSHIPLAIAAITLTVLLALGLAYRLLVLVREQTNSDNINYANILKLTMVGFFFNNFLPTGAGGDIAKAFFLVKGEKNKLLIGSSVLIDRFLGALSIISMGTISSWLVPGIPQRHRILLSSILFILLCIILFFTNKKFVYILYSGSKRFIPAKIKNSLKPLYVAFASYFGAKKTMAYALALSFILQSAAIGANYLMGIALTTGQQINVPISIFFTYIPIIWASTLIPSLGGLGIREFTYVYFFSNWMGAENAAALSMLILLTLIIQSIIGAVILIFLKIPERNP